MKIDVGKISQCPDCGFEWLGEAETICPVCRLEEAQDDLNEYAKDVKRLVEALSYYADEDAWRRMDGPTGYDVDAPVFDWPGDLGDEPWDIAQKAVEGE
jgi:hypothetical protein